MKEIYVKAIQYPDFVLAKFLEPNKKFYVQIQIGNKTYLRRI